MSDRVYLRHRWSHRGVTHRAAVRLANRFLRRVPFGVKYPIGLALSRRTLPYRLLHEGDEAVQVGAPHDTLQAGRSRAIYLALCVGRSGRVVVVEPDTTSVEALRAIAVARDLPQIEVVASGAWSSRRRLTLYVDPAHPATNFTEDTADYSTEELTRFESHTVEVDSLDAILSRLDITHPTLVSITTNGSEREILAGMRATLGNGLRHVALARTDPEHEHLMASLGYHRIGFDDRGYTFTRGA